MLSQAPTAMKIDLRFFLTNRKQTLPEKNRHYKKRDETYVPSLFY